MNEQNLKRGNPDTQFRSGREAVENGTKGGIASGKSRREMKMIKEHLNQILDEEIEYDGEIVSKKHVIAVKAVEQILKDDISARDFTRLFETIRDTVGEKPIDKLQIDAEIDQAIIDEVEAMVLGCIEEEPIEFDLKGDDMN